VQIKELLELFSSVGHALWGRALGATREHVTCVSLMACAYENVNSIWSHRVHLIWPHLGLAEL
jgi:hypothetical protein